MKKILFFAASLVLSFSLVCCESNNKGQSSSPDNESFINDESSINNDSISVADNTEEEAQEQDTYNEDDAKAFATRFFNDDSNDELVTFKNYMTPELYAKCKYILENTYIENIAESPFSEWMEMGRGNHITKPGVFVSSLGDGKFKAVYSEESDFAGDEGGYSNYVVRIKVEMVNGEYKVTDIFNNYPKHKWLMNK